VLSVGDNSNRSLKEELSMENTAWQDELFPIGQETDEDWKSTAQRLQRCICLLLLKNQRLRIALFAANCKIHDSAHATSLPENDSLGTSSNVSSHQ
jgi:hypothetical protein